MADATSLRPMFVRLAVGVVGVAVLLVLTFTVAGYLARSWWRFEQFSHFRVQYFWLLASGALLLAIVRRWRIGALAACGAMINLSAFAPLYWPVDQPDARGKEIKLVSFNVLGRNERYDDVFALLQGQEADLVLLMEVKPKWAERLDALNQVYPYQHIVPRTDNFGIALLSRQPWRSVQTLELGGSVPTVVAEFGANDFEFLIVGTHPVPPGNRVAAASRNAQLAEIARLVQEEQRPVIVMGDLNVTSYSPYFLDLLRKTKLRDSRQGRGLQASWRPRLPILEIPIDHCLVSPEIAVLDRKVGPYLGSDHRPVIVNLRLPSLNEAEGPAIVPN